MGILTSAFAAGQLIFLPTTAWLTTTYGWRTAVLPVAVAGATCAILYILVGRNWPADVDLPAYGETKVVATVPSAEGAIALSLRALKDASQVQMFWLLASTFFICGLSSNGIVSQHFIPFCADNNLGPVMAASGDRDDRVGRSGAGTLKGCDKSAFAEWPPGAAYRRIMSAQGFLRWYPTGI